MASCSQAGDDRVLGFSVPRTSNDINVGNVPVVANQRSSDGHIPFTYMPFQMSPLASGDLHRNPQNHNHHHTVHDLNLPYDMNCALDQDYLTANDFPLLSMDSDVYDSQVTGFDGMMASNCQASDSNLCLGGSMVPQFANTSDGRIRSFSNGSNTGIGIFNMTTLTEGAQSNIRRLSEANSSITNFERSILNRQNSDVLSGAYGNQVRHSTPQPDNADKPDGRFLSLGSQLSSVVNAECTAYEGSHSRMSESSFSRHGGRANYSPGNVSSGLAGFQSNVSGQGTPSHFAGNLMFSHRDQSDFESMTSGFVMPRIPIIPEGQSGMQHYVPTPSRQASGLGNQIFSGTPFNNSSRCSIADPPLLPYMSDNLGPPMSLDRRSQRVPFNSSVLRSNHQIATTQQQKTYVRANRVSPSPAGITLGNCHQHMSGLSLGTPTMTSNVQAAGDQGAAATVKNRSSYSSTGFANESTKRSLDLSSEVILKYQRRKIMAQSEQPFSPRLLQNALGESSASRSMLAFPTSLYSSDTFNGSAVRISTMNQTEVPARTGPGTPTTLTRMPDHQSAFTPAVPMSVQRVPEISSASPINSIGAPLAFTNRSFIPVAAPEGPMLTSLPTNAPHNIMPPHNSAALTAMARNVARRAAFSHSANSPIPASALRRTSLPRSSSTLLTPAAAAALRQSIPAMTALKRASQSSTTMQNSRIASRIQGPGLTEPSTLGFKCMLCKRDLAYTPEGPVSIPPIAPPVAVLPCGHAFHDHCLQIITPEDQSKDPPCIPCAIGEN